MNLFRQDLSESEKEIYMNGAEDALKAFSLWKDGVQYVNFDMMRKTKDAINIIKKEIEYENHE